MLCRSLRRVLALSVACALISLTAPRAAGGGSASVLAGRVTDGGAPRAGVVVALVDPAGDAAFRSGPTDERGAFSIESAPAGSYALLVETDGGAYLASSHLRLAPGVNPPVSLALKAADPEPTPPPPPPPGGGEEPKPTTPPKAGEPGLKPWAKWVIIGSIVVGGALVIDALTSEDEASPF